MRRMSLTFCQENYVCQIQFKGEQKRKVTFRLKENEI